jgi:tetratricopeptide (TPR) repeat protein
MLEFGVVIVTLFTAGMVLGLAYAVDPDAVVIEPINVPEDLMKKGYSSTVITDRLTEEMHRIHELSQTNEESRGVSLGSEKTAVSALEQELDVLGPVWIVRDQLDIKQFKIQGEIVNVENGLEFRLRGFPTTGGLMVAVEKGTLNEIDLLIERAAEEALRFADPYVLAVHYYRREEESRDFTETHGAIQAGLNDDLPAGHVGDAHDHRLYTLWARVSLAEKDYEGAIKHIKMALEIDPTYGMAYHMWGGALHGLGKYREAIEKFKLAIKSDPNMPAVYDHWGDALESLGYPDEAQEAYAIAAKIDPDFSHVHFSRGDLYFRLKNYKEAIRHYNLGLAMNPDNTSHDYNIDRTRKALGIASP